MNWFSVGRTVVKLLITIEHNVYKYYSVLWYTFTVKISRFKIVIYI